MIDRAENPGYTQASTGMEPDPQFQLFELPKQPRSKPQAAPLRHWQLRQDHVFILVIASLIGTSVTFGFGVERGKQLARQEPLAIVPSVTVSSGPAVQARPPAVTSESPIAEPSRVSSTPLATPATEPMMQPMPPRLKPVPKSPAKSVAGRSRFAIQVVTYTQPKLAQRQLERLKRRGIAAFLVTAKDRMALCVGPFPSREDASAKLASLKREYQDCFLRTL